MTTEACELYSADQGRVCGSTEDVRRYLPGLRCAPHRPAALAGHADPDPSGTRPADALPREPKVYGTTTTDPLGRRMFPDSKTGKVKRYGIPSHPCPFGCDKPKGHTIKPADERNHAS